jgi:hypothetical protein
MKQIKWLIELASTKPLMFSLALLLIAISTLVSVVIDRNRKIEDCNFDHKIMQTYYERKIDSLNLAYSSREKVLNDKVEATLNSIIDNYKDQLEEQKNINKKINTTITKNKRLINRNNNQIENLQNEN